MSTRAVELQQALVTRVLTGPGRTAPAARRAAFEGQPHDPRTDALLDRVALHAWKVRDEDVRQPVEAGVTEDDVFELVVCAAIGQATRQLESAMAMLDRVAPAGEELP